jgi:hypothetical protein
VVCGSFCMQGYGYMEVTIHVTFLLLLDESCYTAVYRCQIAMQRLDRVQCLPASPVSQG